MEKPHFSVPILRFALLFIHILNCKSLNFTVKSCFWPGTATRQCRSLSRRKLLSTTPEYTAPEFQCVKLTAFWFISWSSPSRNKSSFRFSTGVMQLLFKTLVFFL